MKFIFLILSLIPAFLIIKLLYSLFIFNRNHKIKMKRMDEWSKMNEELISFGHEIIDNDIKIEYLDFCVDKIFKKMDILDDVSNYKYGYDDILNEVISKYINHIPSLRQKVRDSKLNDILK